MFEKRDAAERHKRLRNTSCHRSNPTPITCRQNQTLINRIHGVGTASADTTELPDEFGILGA